jgi:hypothetical protein
MIENMIVGSDLRMQLTAPTALTLGSCGISINLETGEVTIPEGLTLTEASRAFWEAVSHIARPGFW